MPSEAAEFLKDNTNVVDFGVTMGGALNFVVGPGAIVLDFRYTLGLVKIASEDFAGDDKNGALSLLVGYTFNFGS